MIYKGGNNGYHFRLICKTNGFNFILYLLRITDSMENDNALLWYKCATSQLENDGTEDVLARFLLSKLSPFIIDLDRVLPTVSS